MELKLNQSLPSAVPAAEFLRQKFGTLSLKHRTRSRAPAVSGLQTSPTFPPQMASLDEEISDAYLTSSPPIVLWIVL